jgi:uncharacterized protein YqjF (DUF2071 family)
VKDGVTWVGLTPFRVERFHPPFLPPVPRLSYFPETNVRVYAVGPSGRDGIWFLTLEAGSLATSLVALTAYGVSYRWSEMTVSDEDGGRVRYVSRGRGHRRSVGHDIEVVPGRPFTAEELSDLDHWLTGRWRGWGRVAGRLAEVPVEHEPWPLWRADVVKLEETILESVGLPVPEEPPLVHYSPGVQAWLGPPRCRSVRGKPMARVQDS